MSLNFAIFVSFYILIITSTVGYGYFIVNVTKLKKANFSNGYIGLFGIFFLIFYSYFSHFFISHNYINNVLILVLGLLLFIFFFYKDKKKKNYILFFLFFLFLFIGFIIFKSHDDFSYYHFPYTYYLTQNNLLIGIGNFNHGFRTPSSIFYLNSLFYLPVIKYYFFQIGSFMIMGFTSLIFLDFIYKKIKEKNNDIIFFLSLMFFIFVNIFFYRISEHGTDRSAQILIFLFIIELIIIINTNDHFRENSSKIFVLLILIISLKAFYIFYLTLLFPIIYYLIKEKNFYHFIDSLKNPFFYLSAFIFIFILITNFFNSGCLIYPISATCFENFSWSIPLAEVSQMNDWYEQWAKAGAGPNFRINDPAIYIQNFNWVGNWLTKYFFNKISDFIYGLIFLSIILLTVFHSKNNQARNAYKGIFFIYFILILLFFEWFYNHPALRYGGYSLISLLLFLPVANILSKRNYLHFNIKVRVYSLILITLLIFFTRNLNRLYKENLQYDYNPIKEINYHVDNSYFRIQNSFIDIINKNNDCIDQLDHCNKHQDYNIKRKFNYIIFFRK